MDLENYVKIIDYQIKQCSLRIKEEENLKEFLQKKKERIEKNGLSSNF